MTAGGGDRGGDDENGHRREDLISALNHPSRRRILRLMLDRRERCSPVEVARELDMPLGEASYHVRVLCDRHAATQTDVQHVRGTMQHFYEATIEDDPPIETLLEETREADEAYAERKRNKDRGARKRK